MTTELVNLLALKPGQTLADLKQAMSLIDRPTLAQSVQVYELAALTGSKAFTELKGRAFERILEECEAHDCDEIVLGDSTFQIIYKTVVDEYNESAELDKYLAKRAKLAAELKDMDTRIAALKKIAGAKVEHKEVSYIKIKD